MIFYLKPAFLFLEVWCKSHTSVYIQTEEKQYTVMTACMFIYILYFNTEFTLVYRDQFLSLNPIRPGRGGGGQKVPALTLNVNNFFNIGASDTKLSKF